MGKHAAHVQAGPPPHPFWSLAEKPIGIGVSRPAQYLPPTKITPNEHHAAELTWVIISMLIALLVHEAKYPSRHASVG